MKQPVSEIGIFEKITVENFDFFSFKLYFYKNHSKSIDMKKQTIKTILTLLLVAVIILFFLLFMLGSLGPNTGLAMTKHSGELRIGVIFVPHVILFYIWCYRLIKTELLPPSQKWLWLVYMLLLPIGGSLLFRSELKKKEKEQN